MDTEVSGVLDSTDEAVDFELLQTKIDCLLEQNQALQNSLVDCQSSANVLVQQNQLVIDRLDKLQFTLSIILCFIILYALSYVGKAFYRFISSFF